MIDFAVCSLATFVTRRWSYDTVTAEARIIKSLIEITGLPDVEKFTITDKQIYPRNISSVNIETTESPVTVPV